jgi:hypothetical protein
MRPVLAAILALASLTTHAEGLGPNSVGLHVATYHFSDPARGADPWNNSNPGVYLKWDYVMAGTFINSGGVRSNYIAVHYEERVSRDFSVGAVAGAATGYARHVSPLLGFTGRWHVTPETSAAITLTPKYGPGSSGAAHLTLDHAF